MINIILLALLNVTALAMLVLMVRAYCQLDKMLTEQSGSEDFPDNAARDPLARSVFSRIISKVFHVHPRNHAKVAEISRAQRRVVMYAASAVLLLVLCRQLMRGL